MPGSVARIWRSVICSRGITRMLVSNPTPRRLSATIATSFALRPPAATAISSGNPDPPGPTNMPSAPRVQLAAAMRSSDRRRSNAASESVGQGLAIDCQGEPLASTRIEQGGRGRVCRTQLWRGVADTHGIAQHHTVVAHAPLAVELRRLLDVDAVIGENVGRA